MIKPIKPITEATKYVFMHTEMHLDPEDDPEVYLPVVGKTYEVLDLVEDDNFPGDYYLVLSEAPTMNFRTQVFNTSFFRHVDSPEGNA